MTIYLNGETPAPPLKLNFADNQHIDGYRSLFATAGKIDMDNSLDITRADYKSGYCIFGWIHHIFLSLPWRTSRTDNKWNFTSEYRV